MEGCVLLNQKYKALFSAMRDLMIEPTKMTPGVDLSNGVLLFYGRSIIQNTRDFYEPIYAWVCEYMEDPSEITVVTFKLEYIDAPSVKSILNLLMLLKEVNNKQLVFMINWYYAYGDLELLQLGTILQERLEMEFDFNEFEPNNARML
jgi:hypothetical protein